MQGNMMRGQRTGTALFVILLWIGSPAGGNPDTVGAEPDRWADYNTEGLKAYRQQHYEQAIQLFHDAISSLTPDSQPHAQEAMTLNNLAAAYEGLGRYDEAELHYLKSLTIVEQIQGPNHPDLVLGLTNLGILHRKRGRPAQAERLYQRSLRIMETVLGEAHPHLIPPLLDLAHVSQEQGAFGRSEDYYKRALKIGETELPVAHHQTQSIRMQYASLLRHLNRSEEADDLQNKARRELRSPEQDELGE
ncbi:MAG: hypothetical protein NPIRA02_29870 [Nitrospirales bacterium]|nr:MAG: hypothetical protein NPIRA02_29870 [Nitrospirales bacterium]